MRFDFAVDCGPSVGMGHLSRTLSLARALAAKNVSVRLFLTQDAGASSDLEFPVAALSNSVPLGADMLVIDGRRFTTDRIAQLATGASALAVVDDLGHRPLKCDILINHNIYAGRLNFAGYETTVRLLGPSFALIRSEFAAARIGDKRTQPRALLAFGGGITGQTGIYVAEQLAMLFDGPIDVAVGLSIPDSRSALPATTEIVRGGDMPSLMARATLYVGSLGVTFLEALAAGLPAIVAPVADDQRLALEAARDLGIQAFDTPDPELLAQAAAKRLRRSETFIVDQPDGRGAERVADALIRYVCAERT